MLSAKKLQGLYLWRALNCIMLLKVREFPALFLVILRANAGYCLKN
jgi:hypothetical protein